MFPSLHRVLRVVYLFLLGSLILGPLGATPKRLNLRGSLVLDEQFRPITLRGGNLKVPDGNLGPVAAAEDLKNNLHMNIVRLPIEFKYFPPGHPSEDLATIDENGNLLDIRGNYSLNAKGYIVSTEGANGIEDAIEFTRLWVDELVARGIWVQFEARGNDTDVNSSTFYDTLPPSPRFLKFSDFWVKFAAAFKDTDYIAGYGMLAEPNAGLSGKSSPDEDAPEPVTTLTRFQLTLMDRINAPVAEGGAGDTWTPFWVGTDYNYSTFQFYYQGYKAPALRYPDRVIYVVNCLTPKPWIDDGMRPDGGPISYPQPPAPDNDYSFFLARTASEIAADKPRWWDFKTIFKTRSEEPANIPPAYNKEYLMWFMSTYAREFARNYDIPMVVDQFGSSSLAAGYLTYERDLLDIMESLGFHWIRWGYNAGSDSRRLEPGTDIHRYYTDLGTIVHEGRLVGCATTETGAFSTVRLRTERYSRQIPAPDDAYRWQFAAPDEAIDNRALRAEPVPPFAPAARAPADAPRMDFRIHFPPSLVYPATYYVWLRLRDGSADHGVWVGLNGTPDSGQLASASPDTWSWVNRLANASGPATVTVSSPGFHFFNVWMDQSGVALDEIVLTTDPVLDPNTTLPAYSTPVIDLPPAGASLPPSVPIATAAGTAIRLTWTASTGGACTYNVKRATVSGGPYTTVATPTDTRYTNTPLAGETTYYYVISTVNSAGESPDSTEVSATTGEGGVDYAWFRGQHFTTDEQNNPDISGETADPDHDGLCNLLEYALRLNPKLNEASTTLTLAQDNGYLTLTFLRRKDVIDLVYTVEVSSDLSTWNSGDGYTEELSSVPIDDLADSVTVRDLVPISSASRRFIRLKVTSSTETH